MNNKQKNTMSYYSTLFQRYSVDDSLLDTRTKKRAIGAVLEQIDKKNVTKNEKLDTARLKKLRRAFNNVKWFKNIAASLTFATALSMFQVPPLEANINLSAVSNTKQKYLSAVLDEDSSTQAKKENEKAVLDAKIETTSLHLISNKSEPTVSNAILLDNDSDVFYMQQNQVKSLTVIDTTIDDWESLAKKIDTGSILLLKKDKFPLETILTELRNLGTVESLNIISHGSSGQLHFNNKSISAENLELNKAKWRELGSYLSKDGDINLFGCNIASGEEGKYFINTLAKLTDADIAASVNPTGSKGKGGDWNLEVIHGEIENDIIAKALSKSSFKNILATVNFTAGNMSGGAYSSDSTKDVTYTGGNISGESFIVDGTSCAVYAAAAHYTAGGPNSCNESEITISFTGGKVFDTTSIKLTNYNGSTQNFRITSSAGETATTGSLSDSTSNTVDLSGFSTGLSDIKITNNAGGTFNLIAIDDFVVSNIQVVASGATVSSVTSTKVNGTYKVGDTIDVIVTFSEAVTVTGTPQLTLETGTTDRVVDYSSGSGGTTLTFTYTVQAGDTSADLDFKATTSLALNGGTIKNGATDATLTLASPGAANSLGANKALVVDGVVPTVSSVSVPSNATYKTGQNLSFTVNTNENVTVTGTPRLAITIGSTTKYATYASGSGSSALVFTYSVESGLSDSDGIAVGALELNSGTLKDSAGNDMTLTLNSVGVTTSVLVDSIAPTVSSVSVPNNATYKVGENLNFTVNASENITVNTTGGTPSIALTIGSTSKTATYISGNGTSALVFRYTVDSGLSDSDGIAIGTLALNGGTLKDAAENDMTLTLNSIGATTAVLVDAVVPTVTITSDKSTLKVGETATITFTLSKASSDFVEADITVAGGTLSNFASTSSTVYTATFTPTASSTTAGTIDVSSSKFTDAAGNNNSAATQKSITVDTTPPTVSSVSVPANNTYKGSENLSFTVNTNENVTVTGTPRLAITIGSTTKYATYASGSGSSALVFTYSVESGLSDSDGIAVGALELNSGTLKDSAGNDMTLTLNSVGATTAVLVDAVVPTVSSVSVPSNKTYKTGENLDFTVNTSENITVVTTGGTPSIALTIGSTSKTATYISGNGTSSLVFRYTVQAGESDSDGIAVGTLALNGGTLKDSSGNDMTLTLNSIGATTAVLVDAVNPTVSTYNPTDGITTASPTANLSLTFSENIIKGTGNVIIKKSSDNSIVETIAIANTTVTGTTLTINPSSNLALNTAYYVQIDATAIDDSAGNSYAGISDTTSWNFTTANNQTPTITGAVASQAVDDNTTTPITPFSTITLADADNDNISITLSLDDNAKGTLSTTTIASTTPTLAQTALRAITFTPTNNRVTPDTSETTTITITVNDGTSTDTDNTTTVISTSINDAPTITGTPNTTVNQGVAYSFTPTGNDVDSGQTLLYSISTKPSWASFSTTTGVLNGTPTNSDVGTTSNIVIGVNDGNVTTNLPSFNLEVLNVNDAPVINTIFNDLSLLEDNGTTSYDLNITDIDGDDLNLTVSSSNSSIIMVTPNWTNILKQADYNSTLDFNLTTQANANGFVTITIKLVDENNAIVTDWFDVNVTAVNDAPTFSNISKIVVYKNSSDKNVTLGITDVDDTNLTYSANIINQALANTPTFIGDIMTISPKSNISGNTDINITVSDGEYNVSKSFNYKILSIEDGELKNNDITVSEDVNGTTTTLNIDGNVTISTNENDNNGSVSSKISIDGGTPTKVNSDINGTVVQFTDTGSQTTYSEGNVSAEVNATMTGKAIHSLDVNGTKTQATSEIIGATTTLNKVNGSIQLQTSVSYDSNTTLSVIAKADGSAEHSVTKNGTTSKATSKVKGATTTIKNNGDVDTSAGAVDDNNGYYIKAEVITKPDGTSVTRFIKVNKTNSSDIQIVGNTVVSTTPFAIGNESEIEEVGGVLFIKIKAPLTNNLIIE